MELSTSFSLPVPVDQAWKVLLDIERVAPCVPGATVESAEGDAVSGALKVEVGPVTMTYRGRARVVAADEQAHRAVIVGTAEEAEGTGTARATVTATLGDRGDATEVTVATELAVTGTPEQFGPGVVADAVGSLVDGFAANLADQLAAPADVEFPAAPAPAVAGNPRSAGAQPVDAEVIDPFEVASEPIAKRLVPVAGVLGALVALVWFLRRRRA
jgi:carbon monoxide dehydrogenase subunit G